MYRDTLPDHGGGGGSPRAVLCLFPLRRRLERGPDQTEENDIPIRASQRHTLNICSSVLTSVAAVLLVAPQPIIAADQGSPDSVPQDLPSLSDSIRSIVESENLPGAAVALVLPGGEIWSRGYGVADRSTERPVTDSTLFRIGSTSKMFVGVAALQQEEWGNIELRDPIRELVPGLPFDNPWEQRRPVRLVHVLQHTAGFDSEHPPEIHALADRRTLLEALGHHPHSRTARWPPGRFFAYSNPGSGVAAYAVQQAAGRPFEDYVRQEIFHPLEMSSATYDREMALRRGLAAGYATAGSERAVEYWRMPAHLRPAGAVSASVRDVARFIRMLIQRGRTEGRRLLDSASVRRMESPTTTLSSKRKGVPVGYGLQSYTDVRNGFVWHGHDGGMDGFSGEAKYLDEHDRGYVALFNVGSGGYWRIEDLIEDFLTRDLRPPEPPDPMLEGGELGRHSGYYVNAAPRAALTRFMTTLTDVRRVTTEGNRLEVSPALGGDPETWVPLGDGRFRGEEDPVATHAVVATDAGRFLQVHGGTDGTYERTAALEVWTRWAGAAASLALMASSLVFALIWGPRALLGRLPPREPLQVRAWPLLSSLGFMTFAAGVVSLLGNSGGRIAAANASTLAVTLGSVVLAGAASIGVVQALRYRDAVSSCFTWWYSILVSAAGLLAAGWLAHHGMLGIRLWVY